MTETHVDEAAAALEGLAVMPAHLIPLRDEFLSLKEQKEHLTARQDEIKVVFETHLREGGFTGFIYNGKVKVRRSDVTNTRVDVEKLKDKLPHVYAQFLKISKSVRMNIN